MVVDSTVEDRDVVIVEEAELDVNRLDCALSLFVSVADGFVLRVCKSLVIVTDDVGWSKDLEDVCVEDFVNGNVAIDDWVIKTVDEFARDECEVFGEEVGNGGTVDWVIPTIGFVTSILGKDIGTKEVVEGFGSCV